MQNLSTPKIETMEDAKKLLDKWRPLNIKKISLLINEIFNKEVEKDMNTVKRMIDVLEKSRR